MCTLLTGTLFQGIWSFLLFLNTFRIQKCLETVKAKSFEIITFQEILLFLLFLDTFGKGWEIRRSEGWNVGRLEGQKVRRSEGWKVQVMEGFCPFPKS